MVIINYNYNGAYKPTQNWGVPSCIHIDPKKTCSAMTVMAYCPVFAVGHGGHSGQTWPSTMNLWPWIHGHEFMTMNSWPLLNPDNHCIDQFADEFHSLFVQVGTCTVFRSPKTIQITITLAAYAKIKLWMNSMQWNKLGSTTTSFWKSKVSSIITLII